MKMMERDREFKEMAAGRYDPVKGIGCSGERKVVKSPDGKMVNVPVSMTRDSKYKTARIDREEFNKLRSSHDFEYWCATCCHVRDKATGKQIPFVLNAPQRYVARMFEEDRCEGRPIRFIMLKARQWGGSTLVQMYMAWIQCTQMRNWNSLICAHVKDTSSTIRGMYSEMLSSYPVEMWQGDEGTNPGIKPFERSNNVREIAGRGCRVTVGSSENQEAVRGSDFAMAHLSEVAFWANTPQRTPGQMVRAVCGSVNMGPLTLIVMESTANGVGNYFHTEWLRACTGKSDKRPIFIPWYYIPLYSTPVTNKEKLLKELDEYEQRLMSEYCCTLEQVNWYHKKRREYADHSAMQAEYPTTDIEAFTNTGYNVFKLDEIERLRKECRGPELEGDMVLEMPLMNNGKKPPRFENIPRGPMKVWREPEEKKRGRYESRYIVVVDIGGRSVKSDYSVVAVFDRVSEPGALEVVAQWRGHCDHDILVWKAVEIARWYDNALLVYESNTLECDNTEGDPTMYILGEVGERYGNLYYRTTVESGTGSRPVRKPGFHTNRATKSMAITRLIAALRDGWLVERDSRACDELMTYENQPNGSQGARAGYHDDILITRAIALAVNSELPEAVVYEGAVRYVECRM